MNKCAAARGLPLTLFVALFLGISPWTSAITILSGPTFTPATNAPLAGVLKLTTDVKSRVSVLVSDGTNIWEKDFYDFARTHSVPLLGFKPGQTSQIQVTVYDKYRNTYTAAQPLTFVTAPLPANFPHSVVLKSDPTKMEPGFTLFTIRNRTVNSQYITIIDGFGQVVWYKASPQLSASDVRQLANGDLFIEEPPPANCFLEMNLLGNIVRTLTAPAGYPINAHDGVPTDHGTILYLSDVSEVVSNFPSVLPKDSTNQNPPLETVTVDDNPVVEISATNGGFLHAWSPLNQLDPTRVSYLTGDFTTPRGLDTEHANAVIEDTNDNSIIVSLRDQNAVYKFSRATGKVIWILAPHANWGTNWQQYLLTPVGSPFEWSYGQHAPELTPQGTLLVYDDGSWRASPFETKLPDPDNYSRAVEYSINETNMQITQVWDSWDAGQVNEDRLFTPIVGDADWLPQRRNVLVTYGYIHFVNGISCSTYAPDATMVRLVEYTHDPVAEVVFDISFWDYGNTSSGYRGYFCYRSDRIPDLYPHPAKPVTDLVVAEQNQKPVLEFSADPTHSYLVQASTDLTNWATIGSAVQEGGVGDFDFQDLNASQYSTRFYRVLTQ